jgi:hypothetical protein
MRPSNHYIHGMYRTRIYKIWRCMKGRVLNPNSEVYHRYGGRGITLCDEWHEFIPFMNWALSHGYAENLVLDRENNDGNYEPSNCRWITRKENSQNRTHGEMYGIYRNGKHYAVRVIINSVSVYGGTFHAIAEAKLVRDRLLQGK